MTKSLLLSLSLLFVLPARSGEATLDPARAFAESYNEWIALHQSYDPRILNASELHAWERTKAQWKILSRYADTLY